MAGNLLNIGKTGLYAAQAGLATTGHNIANASVAGFSRQVVIQGAAVGQGSGSGFVGSGTEIADIQRYSDTFLNAQVRTSQTASSSLSAYNAQISQVDNMLADTTSGLSPAMQDFFKSVQDMSANASSTPSRQNFLSSAEALASRFQGINGRLEEIRGGVNSQITSNVTLINSYATQIAKLNDQIGALTNSTGHAPNDLLDTRDQLVLDLNKQVKASVVAGANHSVTVSIGNGQPLVVGGKAFELATTSPAADPSRVQVGYVANGSVVPLADASLTGGELGGLMEFRSATLDPAQNAIGRIAIGIAATFNAQNALGQESSGAMGGDLFNMAQPEVSDNLSKFPPPVAPAVKTTVGVTIKDPSALTTSDYMVKYDAKISSYTVTRLPDHTPVKISPYTAPGPQAQTIDGLEFNISGTGTEGDSFLVRPTINGAAQFSVKAADVSAIAAAGPIITGAGASNKGSAVISEGTVDTKFLPGATTFAPVALTYAGADNTLGGFAAGQAVKVTDAAGNVQNLVVGPTTKIPFGAGSTYEFNGVSVTMKGLPVDGDQFTIARNQLGVRDNRNLLAMGQLQSKTILDNGSSTFQAGYAQLVGSVGNKAREVQVNSQASDAMLAQATGAQQSVSGVNLDEEAANLLKYQQAYQAAGKVMQIASTLFDTLLSLGR
jgi:flagellar hook-associated protein 1 FlgK